MAKKNDVLFYAALGVGALLIYELLLKKKTGGTVTVPNPQTLTAAQYNALVAKSQQPTNPTAQIIQAGTGLLSTISNLFKPSPVATVNPSPYTSNNVPLTTGLDLSAPTKIDVSQYMDAGITGNDYGPMDSAAVGRLPFTW
jgi:hypothetical protein